MFESFRLKFFYEPLIEWDANKIDFWVDDFVYRCIQRTQTPGPWAYDRPFFILLNAAVGGTFVGFPTPTTPFPQRMIVD